MLNKLIFVFCVIVGVLGIVYSFTTDELGLLLPSGIWLGYGVGLLKDIINAKDGWDE